MVQDMYDPELYLAKYKVINLSTRHVHYCSGHYRDVASCSVSFLLFSLVIIDLITNVGFSILIHFIMAYKYFSLLLIIVHVIMLSYQ